ncbi:SNF2 family N-terminal domain [seawater metagenome]|uniref:SNF2 family N-terminal domain n=1 Tax=seawater metagenome TaxID=1561972 RepID=A0A5E8CKV0_9ZZZZ
MTQLLLDLEYNNRYVKPINPDFELDANQTFMILDIDKNNNILIADEVGDIICKCGISGLESNLLLDIFKTNNSLFSYKLKISLYEYSSFYTSKNLNIKINYFLDTHKLQNEIDNRKIFNNVIFNRYVSYLFSKQKNFNDNFWKKERKMSNPDLTQPDSLHVQLYEYQLQTLNWMVGFEKNIDKKDNLFLQSTFDLSNIIPSLKSLTNMNLKYDIINRVITDEIVNNDISTKGGILADEMGLGKTITCVGLVVSNPSFIQLDKLLGDNSKYNTGATLIICPSHLVKQWAAEFKKGCPMLQIHTILTKTNHQKISILDIINADVILVSIQFLTNFNYYVKHNYQHVVPSQIVHEFPNRIKKIKELLEQIQQNDKNFQQNFKAPNFEFFNWHRIIIDEGHELFGGITNSSGSTATCSYLKLLINNFSSKYQWYVSGTPFVNNVGFQSVLKYLDFNIASKNQIKYIDSSNNYVNKEIIRKNTYDEIYEYNNCTIPFNDRILNKIYYRNTQESVKDELTIPPILRELVQIKLSDLERQLYDTRKNNGCSSVTLRQLCCHPLISDKEREILGNASLSLSEVKSGLLEHHQKVIKTYTEKILKLDPTNQSYSMLKKNFTDKVNESKYLVNIFSNMDKKLEPSNNEMCCICMDDIKELVVTSCGHSYCKECIHNALKFKKECPNCRKKLDYQNIFLTNPKPQHEEDDENSLVKKYGSKMGKLIELCKKITNNPKNRVIIFSQWDRLLHLIGNTLEENSIANTYVKGNVYQRNNAITSFKDGQNKASKNIQVIMLSLEHAASGTNLTEATHIIFTDPISGSKEEVLASENQAIGRACRIGQKNQVRIIKLITKDTIEEEIYNKNKIVLDNQSQVIV